MTPQSLAERLLPLQIGPLTVRWLNRLLALIFIGLAVHLLLPQLTTLEEAAQTILQMPWWLVAAAALAVGGSVAGSGYALAALAGMLDERLTVARGTLLVLGGNSVGLVAGGIVGTSAAVYRWSRTNGLSSQTAAVCSTLPLLFQHLVLAVVAAAGLVYLLLLHELARWEVAAFGAILGVLLGLLGGGLWGVTHPLWLNAVLGKLSRGWARVRGHAYDPAATTNLVNELLDAWLVLRQGGWRGPALGAAIGVAGDMLALYCLFAAAGQAVNPGVLVAGYGLPLLLGRISFAPGGIGIVEAAMTAIYVSLDVDSAVVVVVVLCYRLLAFWIPSLVGLPVAAYLQRHTAEPEPDPPPTRPREEPGA